MMARRDGHPEASAPLTVASALTPVRRIGSFVLGCPPWLLGVIALALALLRNGIHFDIGSADFAAGARELPKPLNWFSSSWGPLVVGRLTGIDASTWAWNAGYLVATLAALTLAVVIILRRPTPRRRIAVLLLACSPLPAVLLYGIGRYDLFLITGAALIALSHRWWLVLVGSLIASSGNPEQSIVAAICLFLVAMAPRFRAKRRHALVFLGVAFVNWVAVSLWFDHFDVAGSRALFYPVWAFKSVTGFLYAFPVSLYTWYGAMWLIVLFVIGSLTGRSRWWVVAGLLVLPGLFTVTTLDGTRVFVCVVAAASLFVVHEQLHDVEHGEIERLLPDPVRSGPDPRNQAAVAGLVACALVFLPSLYYYGFNGDIATPWEFLHGPLDPLIKTWENAVQPWVDEFSNSVG